mgnify:CR=1
HVHHGLDKSTSRGSHILIAQRRVHERGTHTSGSLSESLKNFNVLLTLGTQLLQCLKRRDASERRDLFST